MKDLSKYGPLEPGKPGPKKITLPEQLEPYRNKNVWLNFILYLDEKQHLCKPPVNPYKLYNGSTTNPDHWATFDEAIENVGTKTGTVKIDEKTTIRSVVAGVGIVLEAAGLAGVDFDDVIERDKDGKIIAIQEEARQIWSKINSYTEVSVSGTGIHILVKAKSPNPVLNDRGKPTGKKVTNDDGSKIELYDNGRYFTVTGKALKGCPGIEERQEEINALYDFLVSREAEQAARKPSPSVVSCGGSGKRVEVSEDDNALLEKMFNSKHGREIKALYDGDKSAYGGDDSKADQALCNHLAYWTNCDAAQIDRMFRNSGLMRPKWDSDGKTDPGTGRYIKSYRERTMDMALRRGAFREYTAEEKKKYAQKKEKEEYEAKTEAEKQIDRNIDQGMAWRRARKRFCLSMNDKGLTYLEAWQEEHGALPEGVKAEHDGRHLIYYEAAFPFETCLNYMPGVDILCGDQVPEIEAEGPYPSTADNSTLLYLANDAKALTRERQAAKKETEGEQAAPDPASPDRATEAQTEEEHETTEGEEREKALLYLSQKWERCEKLTREEACYIYIEYCDNEAVEAWTLKDIFNDYINRDNIRTLSSADIQAAKMEIGKVNMPWYDISEFKGDFRDNPKTQSNLKRSPEDIATLNFLRASWEGGRKLTQGRLFYLSQIWNLSEGGTLKDFFQSAGHDQPQPDNSKALTWLRRFENSRNAQNYKATFPDNPIM